MGLWGTLRSGGLPRPYPLEPRQPKPLSISGIRKGGVTGNQAARHVREGGRLGVTRAGAPLDEAWAAGNGHAVIMVLL